MTIINYTKEDHRQFLSSFLPLGKAWDAKNIDGKNLYKYLNALACNSKRTNDLYVELLNEYFPDTTQLYISQWEKALGLPDDCIPIASTDEERRKNIIIKLTSISVQTEQDVIKLGELFGFTITFPNSITFQFPPYDVPFIPQGGEESSFALFIQGDFATDPIKADIFKCLLTKLAPVGYRILFVS